MLKKGIYILVVLGLTILLFQSQIYRLKIKKEIPLFVKERLISLGKKAILSKDVPVSAVVLYNDSIIGEGYNTMYRDSDISNHAEIIALNEVFKKQDNTFKNLDRSKLTLYTTFEPCEMCKGALLLYSIENIHFEKSKPLFKQVKSTLRSLIYNLRIKRFEAPNLQENLFRKHPDYKR